MACNQKSIGGEDNYLSVYFARRDAGERCVFWSIINAMPTLIFTSNYRSPLQPTRASRTQLMVLAKKLFTKPTSCYLLQELIPGESDLGYQNLTKNKG